MGGGPDQGKGGPVAAEGIGARGVNTQKEHEIRCPLCGSLQTYLRFRHGEYWIMKCRICTGGFAYPRPKQEEIPLLYGGDYSRDYMAGVMHDKDFAHQRFVRVSEILTHHASHLLGKNERGVLDIGCATGHFLAEFKNRGWKTTGVELSLDSANYAREQLGLQVITEDFSKAALPSKDYDLITMFHVIEHVLDPPETLHKCKDLLRSRGALFIETPNWDSIGALIRGAKWSHFIPPEHLNYFGPTSLVKLINSVNLRILFWSTFTPPVIESIQGWPFLLKFLGRALYDLASILNRGPTLQLLAFKE